MLLSGLNMVNNPDSAGQNAPLSLFAVCFLPALVYITSEPSPEAVTGLLLLSS